MVNAVLKSYIVSDAVLLVTGILLVGAGTIWHNQTTSPPVKESVGRILLLERCPLAGMPTIMPEWRHHYIPVILIPL